MIGVPLRSAHHREQKIYVLPNMVKAPLATNQGSGSIRGGLHADAGLAVRIWATDIAVSAFVELQKPDQDFRDFLLGLGKRNRLGKT